MNNIQSDNASDKNDGESDNRFHGDVQLWERISVNLFVINPFFYEQCSDFLIHQEIVVF
jgi:hypothetical protein